jgi:hypothetical protein
VLGDVRPIPTSTGLDELHAPAMIDLVTLE